MRVLRVRATILWQAMCLLLIAVASARGAAPSPTLTSVFPAGGQAGTTVQVTVAGGNLAGVTTLRCSLPNSRVQPADAKAGPNKFLITIAADALPGQYELQAVTANGLSSTRTFVVGSSPEVLEVEPNNSLTMPQTVLLDSVVNGQIERGDLEHFAFAAQRGQRVVIDCQAERIDSRLRAVLELYDSAGKRLAVNRGWFGVDPLIDFTVPADGTYVIKLADLVFAGSPDHFYRLSLSTKPRVAFTVPSVVERGKATSVTLHGWNLKGSGTAATETAIVDGITLDSVSVQISPPTDNQFESLRLRSNQVTVDGFAYRVPGTDSPVLIGLTDVPVVRDPVGNQTAATAYAVAVPSEVSGQLLAGDEQDWFAITAQRGEVLWLEAFGERIGSPVDLDLSVFEATGETELAAFHDELPAHQSPQFPTSHLDPAGRWVAPADGRYLVLVRNLTGGLEANPRRQYRLSVRREEPDFHLVAVPTQADPAGFNLGRGGSCVLDVLAVRRRGMTGPIHVSAKNLPVGVSCPDIWLGPGVDSAPLVLTAGKQVAPFSGRLELVGHSSLAGSRPVRSGGMVLKGPTGVSSRIQSDVSFSVAGEVPLRLIADGHETKKHHLYGDLKVRHSPGCILDVAIEVERGELGHEAPVRLTGIGVPDLIVNQSVTIPAGQHRGTLSFYLPPTLPVGQYTLAVEGETTIPVGPKDAMGKQKTEKVTVVSNSVTFDVQPAGFVVAADPFAPRKIRRGEVVQLEYSTRRTNGFIGKIHTELDAPGEIVGLRGRGVTFTGQTETGTIQIIASDDAPLGAQPFLRLYGIGVVEDQAVFHGSCFVSLEIVE
ncbi:MAG: hypothetical protein JWN70_5988 [Planctomycetaceae bacterium]|nr:hypothetical protein [Planctomycetaceae bacterium]